MKIRHLLPQGLFGRALLIVVLPLVLVQGVSTYIFYERHWDTMTRRLADSLAGEIDLMVRLAGQGSPETLAQAGQTLGIQLTSLPPDRWEDIPDRPLSRGLRTLQDQLAWRIPYPVRLSTDDAEEEITITIRQPAGGILHFATTRKRIYSPTVAIYLLWSFGLSLILVTTALVFLRNQVRPVRLLARAAEAFGKGHPARRLKPHGATEIRQATFAFNEMQARIQRQMQQRTEMLTGISHDLRTPLTRLRLELEMNRTRLDPADLMAMQANLVEMEKMIEAYLAFARGEDGEAIELPFLPDLLNGLVEPLLRQGCAVQCVGIPAVTLPVRPQAMRRCLGNLLGNACKYGGSVWIRADVDREQVAIHIDDDGPGIPASQQETVFRPFHRLDPSRNPATGGVGLGLTIARDIARSHGGEVTLGTSPEGGLRATVELHL